jgi:UDP-N-acetylglucosamine 4,6-dehydratase
MLNWADLRVLVTGGTGSFGNFVVRRLLQLGAQEVRILSRDEKKQYDMRVFYESRPDLTFVIGDIRDRASVDEAMKGVQVVFQAAALKQVPTCERFPMQAVQTNVLGVENVVQSALEHGVERLIAISTDKAVKPVNVMGMTKAIQERLVLHGNLSRANRGTKLACVRYGNVLRSRGSVIPFFRSQLAQGKRLTITDEQMTRFLLTLNDAIDLVLYAAENGQGGEVFVRKAPAARVMDIARVLSEEAGKPLEYAVIGTLPGEKLNEILVSEEELERSEDCGDYYKLHSWWGNKRPFALKTEYSSYDQVTDLDTIRGLVGRADREFDIMEIPGGEFAKF